MVHLCLACYPGSRPGRRGQLPSALEPQRCRSALRYRRITRAMSAFFTGVSAVQDRAARRSQAAVDRYLPCRPDAPREVLAEAVLPNDAFDVVDWMHGGADRLAEQAQDKVHRGDHQPHEARVARVDQAVE